ncbi:hypothetical protein [Amycolatopsis sp. Hca4]|uniref:WXG100-like domain-containing protein n=1 Tax=Amycolatopsis sp. Hca4 TaxID=2742131 RepID=UPI0015915685|nr:hypothetical protein [Amycolatopsis sp. Hca4]QKV74008.1 hypothetical protein HUT10_09665 [Amycolatopsis sp. Hca4]
MFESGDGPVHPPADLQRFLKVTLGMEWPEGNVGSMRAMSQGWTDVSHAAEEFAAKVRARAADLDRAMDGEYAEAMSEWLTGTVAGALEQLEQYTKQLSASLRNAAADVEKAQILIIVAATFALAQVIFLLASVIFAWMAPAVEAAAQLTLRMIMQQLIAKLTSLSLEKLSWEAVKQLLIRIAPWVQSTAIDVGVSAAAGAGIMASADYFTQLGQNKNHQRDHIDGRSVGQSAIGGAIGGAASGVMTSGARVVVYAAKSAAAEFGKKIPPGLVVLGQLGYATGQAASVAWSNPIVNAALDNPDAFWGGILGAMSGYGRPHLPDRSGGGEAALSPDVPDLAPPTLEKPDASENQPALVIPPPDEAGAPGGEQTGGGSVAGPSGSSDGTAADAPASAAAGTAGRPTVNGQTPATGGRTGANEQGTVGPSEQRVVSQPVTSGKTPLGQLFAPGGAGSSASTPGGPASVATGGPAGEGASRPVAGTTGGPAAPRQDSRPAGQAAADPGRPSTSVSPGGDARPTTSMPGQPSAQGGGLPGQDARPATSAPGQPSAPGAGSSGQDGRPVVAADGRPAASALGQPSGEPTTRPATSGGDTRPATVDARPGTGAAGQSPAPTSGDTRPGTSTSGQSPTPATAGGDARPGAAQPSPPIGTSSGDARPGTGAATQPSGAASGPSGDTRPGTGTAGQPSTTAGGPNGDARPGGAGQPSAAANGDTRSGGAGQASVPANGDTRPGTVGRPSVSGSAGEVPPAGPPSAPTSGEARPGADSQPPVTASGDVRSGANAPAQPGPVAGSAAGRPGAGPAGSADGRPATSTPASAGQAPAERQGSGSGARPVTPAGDVRPVPGGDSVPARPVTSGPVHPSGNTPPPSPSAEPGTDGARPAAGDGVRPAEPARPGGSDPVRPGADTGRPNANDAVRQGADGSRPGGDTSMRPVASDVGRPSGGDAGRPASVDASRPVTSDPGRPAAGDASRSAVNDAGRSAASDAGRPAGGDPGRPVASDAGRPAAGDASRSASNDTARPATDAARPSTADTPRPPADRSHATDPTTRPAAPQLPRTDISSAGPARPAKDDSTPQTTDHVDPADAHAAVVAAQLATTPPDAPAAGGGRTTAPAAAEWSAVRDSVPATRHRGERVTSDGTTVSPLRFDVRRGQTAPNEWVRELSVPVDLVSSSGRVDAGTRRALADGVQGLLDERVNGRHRFADGDRLHVVVDAATPNGPPRPGWEHDGFRRVPVEVDEAARDGQTTWRPDDADAAMHKLLSFVGVDGNGRLGATDLAAIDAAIRDTRAESHPAPEAPKRPAVVADPSGGVVWPQRSSALGTAWTRGADGWYRAEAPGGIERGGERTVVPEGALAVFDAGGDVRHVVLGNGVSFERGLDGGWSPPRTQPGEVRARKTDAAEPLHRPDGSLLAELPPESEKVVDRHGGAEKVVAYRQLKDDAGKWLPQPRVFVPSEGGGWTEHGTGAVAYEGWLASANKAHDAARTLWDIAARSGPEIPEHRRLTEIGDAELAQLYSRGSEADAFAAVFELIRRSKGIALRWTQVSAVHAFGKGQVVNMAAGEGKSWLFFAHAAVNAARPDVDGVQVTTTRGNLADRELPHYRELMSKLGIDVHRLNPDKPPPGPRDGRPTVYLGTAEDVGFTYLRHETLPGQQKPGDPTVLTVSIDEIDEALVYSNSQYILSEGVQGVAAPEVQAHVEWAHDLVRDGMDSGWLEEADFGRGPGQAGGPARLTGPGREKVELLLGRPLTDAEVSRVDMAAAAQWEYRENVHYVQHEGKIYIIDQTTHSVLFNPETSSESRWNGGLAQAVEHKHGLQIRSDSDGSKSVTAHELLSKREYGQKTGASGTANGHGDQFAEKGMSPVVEDMPRYYESRLKKAADIVAADEDAKLAQLARDVQAMQSAEGTRQPQLILATRNDQVATVSGLLNELKVEHEAIDAKWQLEQGKNIDEAFKAIIDAAGAPGKVLVINMQGARGVDITTTPEAKARGDLFVRVTAHSEISADIDVQAENRAGRSGGGGEVVYYSSPKDEIYQLSRHPDVQQVVIRYADAVVAGDAPARTAAEQQLRDLVAPLQPNSGHPIVDLGAARPNAPPAGDGTGTDRPDGLPETRPPEPADARPGEPVELTYHEGLAGALNAAEREFAEGLARWRAANPDAVLPEGAVERVHEEFVAAREEDFEDRFGSLRTGRGAGRDVRAAWESWLADPAGAAGLAERFAQAATTTPQAGLVEQDEQDPQGQHEPVELTYHEGLAGALNAAEREFAERLARWRAAHPDAVLHEEAVGQLHDEFVAAREEDFEDRFGSLRTGPGAGPGVRAEWQSWLDRPAAHDDLGERFTHAATPAQEVRPGLRDLAGDGVVLAEDGAVADIGGVSTGQLLPGVAGALPADVVRQWQRARDVLGAAKLPAPVVDALAVRAGQLLSDAYQTQTFVAPVSPAQRDLVARDRVFRTIVSAQRVQDHVAGLDVRRAEQRVTELAHRLAESVGAPRRRGARGARDVPAPAPVAQGTGGPAPVAPVAETGAADPHSVVEELRTWRPTDWSAPGTWLDRLRELRDRLPAEYEMPEAGTKPRGATAALLKSWVLGMEGVTNPRTGRAISGQGVAALAGPGAFTKAYPAKWWRKAKQAAQPATATAHELLWRGDFTSMTSFDVDSDALAQLRAGAAVDIVTEHRERRAGGREDADLRLVLHVESSGLNRNREGQFRKLDEARAQVLEVLRQAGATAGQEPKVSPVLLVKASGRVHLELLRVPDGGGQPAAHYRGLPALDVAFMGRHSELPLAHADRVVAWVEGQAWQALDEGRAMRPVRFTLNPLRDDPESSRGSREAQFTALVRQGVASALGERGRAGHAVPDLDGFVPAVKVRYEGKPLLADLPARVSSEAESVALPEGYPGEVVERVWATPFASARAGVFAEDRAALAEQFERLAPLVLRRHRLGLRPLDVRLTQAFVVKITDSDVLDTSVGEVARELFARVLEAAQPGRPDKVTPTDLGQELPIGVWNTINTRATDLTATEGYRLTVHPDPRPGWTAAEYREAREVDELPFVPGKSELVEAAGWELRQVVAGAVARAVERAGAAAGKAATVEPITLQVERQTNESTQVHQKRAAALPSLVDTLVGAALAAHRGPDGTLAGGVRITPPPVAVVAGKNRPGPTVLRVTVGQAATAVPARGEAAPREERQWLVRAEPGQPGLQWWGTRLRGRAGLDRASLRTLVSWANAVVPVLRARAEAGVEPPELQFVSYVAAPRATESQVQAEKTARRLVLDTLTTVAGEDGLRRPVGYPDQAVSVVLRQQQPWAKGLELWLLPGPGWTMAGYRAAGALDVTFPPGAAKPDPAVQQRVRWMIAGAAERAAAAGVDRFPVELGLLSGPGEEALGEARLRELGSLIHDTVGEAAGDAVVAELKTAPAVPEPSWPQGMAAGRVVVGDGKPAPTDPGIEPARPVRLVVPSWSGELRVEPLPKRRGGKVAVGRGGDEAPPARVTLDEVRLEEFARQLAEQWRQVPAGSAMPDIRVRVELPRREFKYRDAVLDHVSAALRGLLGRHGVDPRGWVFEELVFRASGIEARVAVSVTPAALTTETQVRADSLWQGGFLGRSAARVAGDRRLEGNELSAAMRQQLAWRVQGFAVRALAPGNDEPTLELGFLAVNPGQAQARQATLESQVRQALDGVPEVVARPGGVTGFLRDRVRFRPLASSQSWAPGVDLRAVESTVAAVSATETELADAELGALDTPSPALSPVPDAAVPGVVEEGWTTAVTPVGESGSAAVAEEDDFAAFLRDYQAGVGESGGGFGDVLLDEEPFGTGFAEDGAPALTDDAFLRNLEMMAGNTAGFGVDDFFAAFDDLGAPGGSGGFTPVREISPGRAESAERARARVRALSRPVQEGDGSGRVRVGVVLGDPALPVAQAAGWLPAEAGVFGVVLVDHTERRAQRVADVLVDAGWDGTDALRLYACDVDGLAVLADGLSRLAGVPVARPIGLLWLGADEVGPAVRVGGFSADGRPLLDPAGSGAGWVWHHPPEALHPAGWTEPGSYELPVPGDAPARLGLTRAEHLAGPGQAGTPLPSDGQTDGDPADGPAQPEASTEADTGAAGRHPVVEELRTWRPADWSGSQTWLDRLRELRDRLPVEYVVPEVGQKASGPTAALLKSWVVGMEGVPNPVTGRAVSGPGIVALAGPGMLTRSLPARWWRQAKPDAPRAGAATATAHESLWQSEFPRSASSDALSDALAHLRTGAAPGIVTDHAQRRAAGLEDADLRLVLHVELSSVAKTREGHTRRLDEAHAQVLDVLRQAGAAAGQEPKVSQILMTKKAGRMQLELLRVPDGGGRPAAHYRGLAVLDVAFMGRFSDLPLAHADRVVAWVEGQARQALEEGRPMRPVRFTLPPMRDEPDGARGRREAQFTALVHRGVGNAFEERERAGHAVPDLDGFVPAVKVRYEGKPQLADLPVRVTSETEAGPLPDDYPGDVEERVWSITAASGRAGILAEDRAALAEQFERLVPLFLRRHETGRRPLDIRVVHGYSMHSTNVDPADAVVREGVGELFTEALAAAQPGRPDKVTPADLGLEFPVGVRNIQAKGKNSTLPQGYWLTVHPGLRPEWTVADYRETRELDELSFVAGQPVLVDVAMWELRHVVAGAVARAVDRAGAAPGKTATVERITLHLEKQGVESAQVHEKRVAALPSLIPALVEAALTGYRGPDGTLAGGVRISPPPVTVVAGKNRPGPTALRVTVGQQAAETAAPQPRATAALTERNWLVRAEPGQPGLQWRGTRESGQRWLDPASLRTLWSWAKAVAPMLRARAEAGVEPPELQFVGYVKMSRNPANRTRMEEFARRLVLGSLSRAAGEDGLRRPVGYPGQAVSVVLHKSTPKARGFELWLLPGPDRTVAGYRAAGALDVTFPPGAAKLAPVVEQGVRSMIAGAAERAAAAGVDRFPVELGLLSGPGEEELGEARLRELESLIHDVVGEAAGDAVVAEPRTAPAAPDSSWPRGMAAGWLRVGDGTPAPAGPGIEPARPLRLVVPSWSGELRVEPLPKSRDGKVAVGRNGDEAPPARVTFDEVRLEEFARQLAEQWRQVPAGTAMPDIRVWLALPPNELRYRDAALDRVSEVLRGLLRRHGADPRGWVFEELAVQAPGIEAQASVSVTPAVLTTEARVRADSLWQGSFVGRGALTVTGGMRPEGNGLSAAMRQQLTWRVQEFAARALASGYAGLVLELGFLAANQAQAQARQAALEPLVRKALGGVPEVVARPGGVAGFLRDRVRYRPLGGWQQWAPGTDLRLAETTSAAEDAPATERTDAALDAPSPSLSLVLAPEAVAGPSTAEARGTADVASAAVAGPSAFVAEDDDFAAFLRDYQAGVGESGGGFGDVLLDEEPFGTGFAEDGAPALTDDAFLRNLEMMAGNTAGFGVDDFFAAFDDLGAPGGSGGFTPVREISPGRAESAERARARVRALSRPVQEGTVRVVCGSGWCSGILLRRWRRPPSGCRPRPGCSVRCWWTTPSVGRSGWPTRSTRRGGMARTRCGCMRATSMVWPRWPMA